MDLEKELDYAYDLIVERFSVNFTKPKILTGDEHESKFIERTCLNDFARPSPQMIIDDETNTIFVPDILLPDGDFIPHHRNEYDRLYDLLHESGHSLISQLNYNLLLSRVSKLAEGNEIEREKGETLFVFHEGMAHYIAIEACRNSEDNKLIEKANEMEKDVTDLLKQWLKLNLTYSSKIYGIDSSDWRKVVIIYLRRNKGAAIFWKYQLGYHFTSSLKPGNIVEVIKNPPENYEELLYPNVYKKRLKMLSYRSPNS